MQGSFRKLLDRKILFSFLFLVAVILSSVFIKVSAFQFTKRYDFINSIGASPYGSLIVSGDLMYGMTLSGGANNVGSIFEFNSTTGSLSKLHDFDTTNGSNPYGDLILSNGSLFGMTLSGGLNNGGVIFEYNLANNTFTNRYDFTLANGIAPYGSLREVSGKFYGVTSAGGASSVGVIFEFDPSTGTYTKLHDFLATEGSSPRGALVVNGTKLYGLTNSGGASGVGSIFEFNLTGGVFNKLHDFDGVNGGTAFGSPLFVGTKMYGLTSAGGAGNVGVIFSFDIADNSFVNLHDFDTTNGSVPYGSLIEVSGKLYGMTLGGGANSSGVIFVYNIATDLFSTKNDLSIASGSSPAGSLVLSGNKLYGLSTGGGSSLLGVIFEWDITNSAPVAGSVVISGENYPGSVLTGSYAYSDIDDDSEGTSLFQWYRDGIAISGANSITYSVSEADRGTSLKLGVTPVASSGTTIGAEAQTSGVYITTYYFTKKADFAVTNGSSPLGGMVVFGDKMYGTSKYGGANNMGTIFEYEPLTGVLTSKHDFDGITTGSSPDTALLVYDNKLYGTATTGGANNFGVIFEYDPVLNSFTKKHDFSGTDGSYPTSQMISFGGKFYGTTFEGGVGNFGVIFEYDPALSSFTKKHDFSQTDGAAPSGILVELGNKIYGTTYVGGAGPFGTIFEFDPATGVFTKKYDFDSTNGANPYGGLVVYNTKLYGTAVNEGDAGYGVIFEYDPTLNSYTKKHSFTNAGGASPFGGLLLSGTKLFGITSSGGLNGAGVIYTYDLANSSFVAHLNLLQASSGASSQATLVEYGSKIYGVTNVGGSSDVGIVFDFYEVVSSVVAPILNFSYRVTETPVVQKCEEGGDNDGNGVTDFADLWCLVVKMIKSDVIKIEAPTIVTSTEKNENTITTSTLDIATSTQVLSIPEKDKITQEDKKIEKEKVIEKNDLCLGKDVFARNLYVGVSASEVVCLQKFLNSQGAIVSESGPGSIGFESVYFGIKTKKAVSRFQKMNNIKPALGFLNKQTIKVMRNLMSTDEVVQ